MAPSARQSRYKHLPRDKDKWIIWRKITYLFKTYPPEKLLCDSNFTHVIANILIIIEIFLNVVVIEKIAYTEIDWKAYMQEVEGVINGTLDYEHLKGDTGPLVYPAGFVYIFLLFYFFTQRGTNIYFAQYIFAALYVCTLFLVFRLYKRTKKVPPYALVFMCFTSYRIHSIYVLRLFNDPVAIFFFFMAVNCFVEDRWTLGCVLFSFAVSVKMNIMLFAPGLFYVLLVATGLKKTFFLIGVCAAVQLVVGFPFLLKSPISYISRAFNLGRVFLYQWTVNWRLLPEDIFVNRNFHIILLVLHISVLLIFAYRWKRCLYPRNITNPNLPKKCPSLDDILLVLFTSNFIGMVFCRSLHYQFYVWYFFTLPYILWSTFFNPIIKLCVLGFLELSWNTYPSTILSSCILHCCHLIILYGLYVNIPRGPSAKAIKENDSKAN